MKRNLLNIILGMACILTFSSKAQALPSDFENQFSEAAINQTKRYYMKNPSGLNKGTNQQRSGVEKNRMNSESEGISGLAPKEARHSANVYAPMAGVADTMHSKVHANALGKGLGSPVTLYNVTMQLTEPAVASGLNNSLMQSIGYVDLRYSSEDHFKKELDSKPESRQILLPAYQECIANEMRERDIADPDKVKRDKGSWIQAQSICMGDRTNSFKKVYPKAEEFDKLAEPAAPGFTMLMDPHSAYWQTGSGKGLFKNNRTLFLTDYLFNQSNFDEIGIDAVELKKSFEDLLGNYEFVVEDLNEDKIRSASRELKYTKSAPAKTRSEILDEAEKDNYNKIVELVNMRCEHNKSTAVSGKTADENSFCVKNRDNIKERFIDLSFVGFEFDCNLLEDLFKVFTFENGEIQNKGTKGIDCSVISSKDYESMKNSKDQYAKSGHSNVVFLAGEISVGQLYMVVYNIQQVIDSVTPANKQFAKNFANQLINDFIGNGNLYEMYKSVLANIEVFKQRLAADIERKRKGDNRS